MAAGTYISEEDRRAATTVTTSGSGHKFEIQLGHLCNNRCVFCVSGELTAQGKASGILLAILPYALLAALAVVAPDMASALLTTSLGHMVLVGVTVSVCLGGIVIKKIVTIPVE